jgi:tetratricopeptide (TPR) repeat protein
MRHSWIALAMLLAVAGAAQAQIGKSVSIAAGTPEDKALSDIYAATDPAQKIVLLDKFMSDFGKGDLELLGDQLYASTYLEQKNYDKALEYGDKALALDPDNLATAVNQVRAAEGKGDSTKLFDSGERVAALLPRYKASPAPEGISAASWDQQKADNLKNAQADIGYVQYTLFKTAYETRDPAAKAALLERYVAAFPDSPYAANAQEATAFAYQQAQNYPKMLAAAQKLLAADANNAGMLLLLADYWSEKGQQLDQAEQDAKKAIGVLAQAKKPEGVSDEQWQQQVSLQNGLAYSALGQVYVNKNENPAAVEAFKKANPLLKSNPTSYGRNLYRLGFTLAKMQRIPEARTVLTEAVAVNSPYRALAQQTLTKIGGAAPRRSRKQ